MCVAGGGSVASVISELAGGGVSTRVSAGRSTAVSVPACTSASPDSPAISATSPYGNVCSSCRPRTSACSVTSSLSLCRPSPRLPARQLPRRRFPISRWTAGLVIGIAAGWLQERRMQGTGRARAHLWRCGQHRRRHGTQQHYQREASPHLHLRVHATVRACGLVPHRTPANQLVQPTPDPLCKNRPASIGLENSECRREVFVMRCKPCTHAP